MQGNVNIPDSTITSALTFRNLVLMNMQQLTNFPYIENDFDALTDYELLCLVVKFLNDVIDNQNEQNDSITNMYNAFLALQTYVNNTKETLEDAFNELDDYVRNYFDNLDVQEEINNKLDQMLEDGVLEQIIEQFIQSTAIWCFDTVADMKAATNLIDGSFAKTLGYYSVDDGGESTYKITNTESLTDYQEELTSGLYATLILNNKINVHQVGAYGDGTHDDSDAINQALSLAVTNINFGHGKTYMVRGYEEGQAEGSTTGLTATTGLIIPSNKIVDLCESEVKCITNSRQNYNIFTIKDSSNVILKNGKITGDRKNHTGNSGEWGYGVSIRNSSNISLSKLICSECWGDGININNNGDTSTFNKNIIIKECICDSNRRQGMSIENGDGINITDSSFINTGNSNYRTNPASGVDIEPGASQYVKNITFDRCNFSNNYNDGILIDGANINYIKVLNSLITDNSGNSSNSAIGIIQAKNILFENNEINTDTLNTNEVIAITLNESVKFINNKIKNMLSLIRTGDIDNSTIEYINNTIIRTTASQWNDIIETIATDSTSVNNIMIVKNNKFIATDNTLNIRRWIFVSNSATFKKLICDNNSFKYGRTAITCITNCIISNNDFIAQYDFPLNFPTGDDDRVAIIKDNIIEEPCYNSNVAGVIGNGNNNNINISNNTVYKNCLSSYDQVTRNYSPSRMLQTENPTGASLNVNNNILDNTIS